MPDAPPQATGAEGRRYRGAAKTSTEPSGVPSSTLVSGRLTRARMFKSVLIANRGEIACRIAPHREAAGAAHDRGLFGGRRARAARAAVRRGASRSARRRPRESYLAIERLIDAARKPRAPNASIPATASCRRTPISRKPARDAGIVFVGPPPAAIRAMGLKDRAKALMEKAGVPVVPGYHGERQEPKFLKQKAYEIGYPVLIKAVAGGGGKGMRRVDRHAEFDAALEGAQREAQAAFGDGRVLIEKYVAAPRHIEMQVFADRTATPSISTSATARCSAATRR